ncbi:MAG: glycosyltransferase family 4 protein [Firmicutes bacterium]|nr:glycosyltransferase family 4 protein [Bacillota bacterium]
MRIGIDTLSVVPNRIGGGEIYLQNLVRNLAEIDKENEYFIFATPENRGLFETTQGNFHTLLCRVLRRPSAYRLFYQYFALPVLAWRYRLDVIHSGSILSPFLPCRAVLTVQYLTYFDQPQLFPRLRGYLLRSLMQGSCRKASLVIAISEYTKRGVCKYFGLPEGRVVTIYHGVDRKLFRPLPGANGAIFQKLGMDRQGKYILSVGTSHSWKNIAGLVSAFALLKSRLPEDFSLHLVHVGLAGTQHTELLQLIKNLGLAGQVVLPGYVPHEEMPDLYRGAALLVFPSFGESFGLPILEAMACGVPVIASDRTAMPEVAGEASLAVNPEDTGMLAEAMRKVLQDEIFRKELVARGLNRAALFSWEETARQTGAVLKKDGEERHAGCL